MVSVDDVARLAAALPGVEEGTSYGHRAWLVGGRRFAWLRPFSKADVRRFGDRPVPAGPVLALAVEDLGEKQAVLAEHPATFLDIPHLDGHPVVLVRLDAVGPEELAEALEDAWLATAPAPLARGHRADGSGHRSGA
ncbi:MmcQ/YjbR family DNA-binding protein [Puerhibacterium puerhi]|uniref:MmcQ/YjbR family DNA-binding protein n=1 Tax=Puerhibacterium puerhi TaxID=2692623 RepID=UPI00135AB2D9|nr:MmcQ/YjbR family DNA-binding protein [Puerhibacterium puerhi]